MKASELITRLQDAIDKYGDLDVIDYDYYDKELKQYDFRLVDIEDNIESSRHFNGKPVKIWLDFY